MNNLKIFGADLIDQKCIDQIKNCISDEDLAVLTADAHYGYGHPIGGAVAYRNKVSLSGVGFDIGCGNKAVRTNIQADDIDVARVMSRIIHRISFGVGMASKEVTKDHPVYEAINKAEFAPQREMLQLAKSQLGTVGSGNHYIDLFRDEDGWLWIGNHFGSRGFGHKTAMGFIAMSQGLDFTDKGSEGGMDSPPILFDTNTYLGQAYIEAMTLAGAYASAGRDVVISKVLDILHNPEVTFEVHNHHNFAWQENHFGDDYWVVRKGCTPAFPGQMGFIGSNMLDTSVIIEGQDTPTAKDTLYSTVHGAGRVMSRTEAAGKTKWLRGDDGKKRQTVVRKGKVDFTVTQEKMAAKGIELRGAGADESPECYKKLADVLGAMGDTVRIVHLLDPIGVAMASNDIVDPYKD